MLRLFVLLTLLLNTAWAQWPKLQPMMADMPPFQYIVADQWTGFVWDLWQEMLAESAIEAMPPYELPWARALVMAERQSNGVLFTAVRTPEREPLFQWVGPIIPANEQGLQLWRLNQRDDLTLESFEHLNGRSLAVLRGSVPFVFRNVALPDLQQVVVSTNEQRLLMLAAQRVDYVSMDTMSLLHLLQRMQRAQQLDLGFTDLVSAWSLPVRFELYFALNNDVPVELVAQLQSNLDRLKQSGDWQRLWQAYRQHYQQVTLNIDTAP